VTGYRVERCQGSTCTNFAQIATPIATTFGDTGLATSTSYRYQARATDAAGNLSAYSAIATTTTAAVNVPPVASFTATPTTGTAPLTVGFSNGSTGTITSYAWNFGDSTTSTAANPSKVYSVPGVYTVTLTVSGPAGSDTQTRTGYVTVNSAPASSYTLALTASAGGSVTASPSQSSYAPGTVVTLTATPLDDYVFTGWSGGDVIGNASPVQITMNANRSVGAGFSPILVPTGPSPATASISGGAGSPVLSIPVVARTASFESEIFIDNPTSSSRSVNVRFYGARGTTAAGANSCPTQAVPARSTIALSMTRACPGLPAGSQFGSLLLSETTLRQPLVAYSRTSNPQGNGFSVEAYPLGEFSSARATVTGLKRVMAGSPPFQTNCFVGALGEGVDYRITLTDGTSGRAIGSPVTGTLAAWETVRYLDIFGPTGANAPAGDYANVRADFSVVGSTQAGLVGFCTVQDNRSFGADFRLAKSIDADDESQRRTVHVGHDGSGVLSSPTLFRELGRKHVWLTAVRHPDVLSCTVVGPRSSELEIRLREPGAVGSGAVRAGGNDATSFAWTIAGRASVNAGITGFWAIEVGPREGGSATLPIAYGLTCRAGNGLSTPLLVNPVGFADDF
jgi:PKD repeat protein